MRTDSGGQPMKATGIVRRIDDLGRYVIPKEIRTTLKIPPGTPLEIFVADEGIVLRKYQAHDGCVFCGEMDGVGRHHGRPVCAACRKALAKG
jgi:transcriptional pleiotropic regulator of transition state genes